jgi:hypothetical protein
MSRRLGAMLFTALVGHAPLWASCTRSSPSSENAPAAVAPEPIRAEPPAAPHPDQAPRPADAKRASRLPEDPVEGERSRRQWDEHLRREERERQELFDKPRVAQHRAVVARIAAARRTYDTARTQAAVSAARNGMPPRLAEIAARVKRIDPWGVNSPLLPDYAALQAMLRDGYAEAKLASLGGDPGALERLTADFDARMKRVSDWLEEAEHSRSEYEERGDEEDENEAEREP